MSDTPQRTLSEADIRHDERRRLIRFLNRSAKDPARVGKRVILLGLIFDNDDEWHPTKGKDLAERLGVSEACVSKGLAALQRGLRQLDRLSSKPPQDFSW